MFEVLKSRRSVGSKGQKKRIQYPFGWRRFEAILCCVMAEAENMKGEVVYSRDQPGSPPA